MVSSNGQELKEIVVAIAELQIADAKLGLQHDHMLRSHAAALESIFIVDPSHGVPRAMKAAKVQYDEKTHGKKGHDEGAPDEWTYKAVTLALAQCLNSPEKDALLAHAGQLSKPADFMDIIMVQWDIHAGGYKSVKK